MENLSAAEILGLEDGDTEAFVGSPQDDPNYGDWLSEVESGRWDDDPNPYHGDYGDDFGGEDY